jgi:hypothetical protein
MALTTLSSHSVAASAVSSKVRQQDSKGWRQPDVVRNCMGSLLALSTPYIPVHPTHFLSLDFALLSRDYDIFKFFELVIEYFMSFPTRSIVLWGAIQLPFPFSTFGKSGFPIVSFFPLMEKGQIRLGAPSST